MRTTPAFVLTIFSFACSSSPLDTSASGTGGNAEQASGGASSGGVLDASGGVLASGGASGGSLGTGATGASGGTAHLGRGINLSSAEWGTNIPGTYGVDYTYPTTAEVDRYMGLGMDLFRIPFLWERLQPTLSGELDAEELGRLDALVSYATEKGVNVILDVHNYARYGGALLGSDGVTNEAFSNLWSRLAAHYKDDARIVFGLMNEPYGIEASTWLVSANAAIAAIRAVGAKNLILVPGTMWTGAHSWLTYNTAMLGVIDSGENFAFEVHQYLNADSSGSSGECVSATIGIERISAFSDWLKENGKRGFLGEFGAGVSSHSAEEDAPCADAMNGMLSYIDERPELWIGWTYFAGGPWWESGTSYTIPDGESPWQLEALESHL